MYNLIFPTALQVILSYICLTFIVNQNDNKQLFFNNRYTSIIYFWQLWQHILRKCKDVLAFLQDTLFLLDSVLFDRSVKEVSGYCVCNHG